LIDEITSSHRKTMAPDREAGRVSPVAGNGAARANASLPPYQTRDCPTVKCSGRSPSPKARLRYGSQRGRLGVPMHGKDCGVGDAGVDLIGVAGGYRVRRNSGRPSARRSGGRMARLFDRRFMFGDLCFGLGFGKGFGAIGSSATGGGGSSSFSSGGVCSATGGGSSIGAGCSPVPREATSPALSRLPQRAVPGAPHR